ncbi:hypothetical protein TNCV_3554361 [Trichonephila clavipes]|nr:hypothetical protein TNCV_3554361 [Trichonephila clavipes]
MRNFEVKKGERESIRGLLLERVRKRPLSQRYLGVRELTKTKVDLEPRSSSQQEHCGDRASELIHSVGSYRTAKTFSSELWTLWHIESPKGSL